MSEKTCKDCLHCTVDDDEVLCVDMPWHYPFGGNDYTTLDKEACKYFLERPKKTIFDRITESPETLAEELVYWVYDEDYSKCGWTSNLMEEYLDKDYEKAIAATVAKLKEVME